MNTMSDPIAGIGPAAIFDDDARGDLRHYVLVDPSGMPELADRLRRNPRRAANLFRLDGDLAAQAVSPLLLPWELDPSAPEPALERWIFDAGKSSASVLWLASPLGHDALARRLAQRVSALLPDDVGVVLRYFDTRVFEALLQALPQAQRDDFLGVAAQWVYWNRRCELARMATRFDDAERLDLPLRLDAGAEAALIDASEPDQIAEMLDNTVPEQYRAIPFARRFDFIERHRRAARELGLEATMDRSLYCALALMYGEDFAGDDAWKNGLEKVARKELTLQALVEAQDQAAG